MGEGLWRKKRDNLPIPQVLEGQTGNSCLWRMVSISTTTTTTPTRLLTRPPEALAGAGGGSGGWGGTLPHWKLPCGDSRHLRSQGTTCQPGRGGQASINPQWGLVQGGGAPRRAHNQETPPRHLIPSPHGAEGEGCVRPKAEEALAIKRPPARGP